MPAFTDPAPPITPLRARLRERLLLAGPALAVGLLLAMLWGFVAWFALIYPKSMEAEYRKDLASTAAAAAVQTEAVLRDAENSLRTVDLWLLTRGRREPLSDASLAQLVETLRGTSRTLVDVMLVSRGGEVFRIPTNTALAHADVSKQAFYQQLASGRAEGLVLGLPLRLRDEARQQLPLAMALSAPAGELLFVMALIDLPRLGQLHQSFARGPESAVTLLRGDGRGLSRTPALEGFAGRDVFADRPWRRKILSGEHGFFVSDGSVSDGRSRLGAYQSVPGFDVKLLVSQGEDATWASHLWWRRLVLILSTLISVAALLITVALQRLQRTARLRDAEMLASSNASPLGLFRCDLSGRTVYANETYQRLLGLAPDEVDWGWLMLLPEVEREQRKQEWSAQMLRGETINTVRQVRLHDGSTRLVAVRAAPLLLNGRVAGQVGTLDDISELVALQKSQGTLTAIFDLTPDIVCQVEPDGQLLYLNPAGRRRLGLAPDASLAGISYLNYFTPARAARLKDEILPIVKREGHWHGRSAVLGPGDIEVPVESTVLVHPGADGQVETISVLLRDISSEQQALRQRQRIEAMLVALAHTAPVMISVLDTQQCYLFFNEAFAQHFNVQREDWVGRHLRELIGEAEYAVSRPLVEAALAGERSQIEKTYERQNAGGAMVVEIQYAPLLPESGEIEGVICLGRDITEARREESRLRHASQTDPLTELLNRSGFALGFDAQLAQARQTDSLLGLLYLDLDHFKPVNDEHGHPVGDALLKAVAGRLRHTLRPQDLVARLGGDEFAVLLPALAKSGDAATVAAKLVHALGTPFMIGPLQLQIGASVGYCVAPGGRADMEQMMAQADAKLYEAKRAGRGRFLGGLLTPTAPP